MRLRSLSVSVFRGDGAVWIVDSFGRLALAGGGGADAGGITIGGAEEEEDDAGFVNWLGHVVWA